jgi:hypothetical protein
MGGLLPIDVLFELLEIAFNPSGDPDWASARPATSKSIHHLQNELGIEVPPTNRTNEPEVRGARLGVFLLRRVLL